MSSLPPLSGTTSSLMRRSVSTVLVPRRIDPFGVGWKTHVVVLALSWVIWWMLDQQVASTAVVGERTALTVVLDPTDTSLGASYSVLRQPHLRPSLMLAGPRKELSNMQDMLGSRKSPVGYELVLSSADLAGLSADAEHQIVLERPVSRFVLKTLLATPFEGSLSLADPGESARFVIEERVELSAVFNDSALKAPATHERVVTVNSPVRVRAAWSVLKALLSADGKSARVDLVPQDFSALSPEELAAVQTRNVGIQPVSGVEFFDEQRRPVSAVNVSVAFTPIVSFEEASCVVPVSYLLPGWMVERQVAISLSVDAREFEVRLLVDPDQRAQLHADVVRVVLDLQGVKPEDLDPISSSRRHKARLTRYLRLDVDRSRLSFFRIPEDMSATIERYYPVIVTFEWSEG